MITRENQNRILRETYPLGDRGKTKIMVSDKPVIEFSKNPFFHTDQCIIINREAPILCGPRGNYEKAFEKSA
jgi:hypothetical protein